MPLGLITRREAASGSSRLVFSELLVGAAGDFVPAATIGLSRIDAVIATDASGIDISSRRNSSTGVNTSNGALFLSRPRGAAMCRFLALGAP